MPLDAKQHVQTSEHIFGPKGKEKAMLPWARNTTSSGSFSFESRFSPKNPAKERKFDKERKVTRIIWDPLKLNHIILVR